MTFEEALKELRKGKYIYFPDSDFGYFLKDGKLYSFYTYCTTEAVPIKGGR